MSVFTKVADLGSFAAAAKQLRLSPTMIGKHIRFLEERLGSQLINRSTRRQSLTELGRNYLDHCRHLLEEAEAGDAWRKRLSKRPAASFASQPRSRSDRTALLRQSSGS
jgi:DNA-binding transcriptional LysR family regulator